MKSNWTNPKYKNRVYHGTTAHFSAPKVQQYVEQVFILISLLKNGKVDVRTFNSHWDAMKLGWVKLKK